MAYQMRIDEMLGCLFDAKNPQAEELKLEIEAVANRVAEEMRKHFNVDSLPAIYDLGETMVGFRATEAGQKLPIGMAGFDTPDAFEDEASDGTD